MLRHGGGCWKRGTAQRRPSGQSAWAPSPISASAAIIAAHITGYSQPPPAFDQPKPLAQWAVIAAPSSTGTETSATSRVAEPKDQREPARDLEQHGGNAEPARQAEALEETGGAGRGEDEELGEPVSDEQGARGGPHEERAVSDCI